MFIPALSDFPKFHLERLLKTCFGDKSESVTNVCILIDLTDLSLMKDLKFLDSDGFSYKRLHTKFSTKDFSMASGKNWGTP